MVADESDIVRKRRNHDYASSKWYFSNIKGIPQLSADEEHGLCKGIFDCKTAIDSEVIATEWGRESYVEIADAVRSGRHDVAYFMIDRYNKVPKEECRDACRCEMERFVTALPGIDVACADSLWRTLGGINFKEAVKERVRKSFYSRVRMYRELVDSYVPGLANIQKDSDAEWLFNSFSKSLGVAPEDISAYAARLGSLEDRINSAVNTVADAHLKLVAKIAGSFRSRGLDKLDLIQAGNIGLLKAIRNFDYRPGNRVAYYAILNIKRQIRIAIGEGASVVRVHDFLRDYCAKIYRAAGRDPDMDTATAEEVSRATGLGAECVRHARQADRMMDLESLDDDGIDETVADESAILPEDAASQIEMMRVVGAALDALHNGDEKKLLELRYWDDCSLDDIGTGRGVSRQSISFREHRAWRNLISQLRVQLKHFGKDEELKEKALLAFSR